MAKGTMKAAAVAATVAAGALLGAAAVSVARRHCLQVIRTKHGIARVHVAEGASGERIRVLSQGGVYQSASYLGELRFEPVFSYYRGFDIPFSHETPQSVLLIGGGGFSYPKHLLTSASGVHLDVVELNAAVVRAARRWFFLDELERRLADPRTADGNSLRIIVGDGRDLVERGEGEILSTAGAPSVGTRPGFAVEGPGYPLRSLRAGEIILPRYDAIINDAFAGAEPAPALATVEAVQAIAGRLAPGGLYLSNVVSRDGGRDLTFLRDEIATLLQVFAHVQVIETSDEVWGGEDNYLVVASDRAIDLPESIPFGEELLGRALRDPAA